MRTIKAGGRRRSTWPTAILVLLAIVLGGGGSVFALGAMNVIDLGKLAFWKQPKPFPADWVELPLCAQPIPAYTRVTKEYLVDPHTRHFLLSHGPAKDVPAGALVKLSDILGRVTARPKPPGYDFHERDFLPKGTLPGVVGAIPPGKRAYTLDLAKVNGMYDLQQGDHFDLLASIPVDMPGAKGSAAGHNGLNVVASPAAALLPKRSVVRPLVQDGVLIVPMRIRRKPITSNTLMAGTTVRTVPVEEAIVAINPDEVARLEEAVGMKYDITCAAQTGQPSPPAPARPAKPLAADKGTPGFDPLAGTRSVEVMVGPQRQYMVFAGPGGGPLTAQENGPKTKDAETPGAEE